MRDVDTGCGHVSSPRSHGNDGSLELDGDVTLDADLIIVVFAGAAGSTRAAATPSTRGRSLCRAASPNFGGCECSYDVDGVQTRRASGAVTAPSGHAVRIGAGFSKATTATFAHNGGAVDFEALIPAQITASPGVGFYDLVLSNSSGTYRFGANQFFDVANDMTANGTSGDTLTLERSGGSGSDQWNLDITGAANIDFVTVSDSNNIGPLISPASWTDAGNNVGWGDPPPPGTFSHITYASTNGYSAYPAGSVRDVLVIAPNDVWVSTDTHLGHWNGSTWSLLDTSNSAIPTVSLTDIEYDPVGPGIWIGTYDETGLLYYDFATWTVTTTADGLPDNDVWDIELMSNGDLCVGGGGGVGCYDGASWSTLTTANGLTYNSINRISEGPGGDIWAIDALNDSGVHRCTGGSCTQYLEVDGLPSDVIRTVDWGGSGPWVYVTSSIDGAARTNDGGTNWEILDAGGSGIIADYLREVVAFSPSRVFFASAGSGLSEFDGTSTWINSTYPGQIVDQGIYHLDTDGTAIWALHQGQASIYNGSWWTSQLFSDAGLGSDTIYDVFVVGTDVWFSGTGGVSRWDGGSGWTTWNHHNSTLAGGLSGDAYGTYRAITRDPATGDMWVASQYHGAFYYSGATWTQVDEPDLSSDRITDIVAHPSRGEIWFASSDAGITVKTGGSYRYYTTADGLPNNNLTALALAPSGEIWASSSSGAAVWNPGTDSWTTYTTPQLPGNQVLDVDVAGDGTVWFACNSSGLAEFDGFVWNHYTAGVGSYVGNQVFGVDAAPNGDIWVSTPIGAANVYNGLSWTSYTEANSAIPYDGADSVAFDGNGDVYIIGGGNGDAGVAFLDLP